MRGLDWIASVRGAVAKLGRMGTGLRREYGRPGRGMHRAGGPESLEQRALLTPGTDFGDAPDTGPGTGPGNYQTTAADGGPSHSFDHDLYLGAKWDDEQDASPNAAANGDDIDNSPDDEDGVVNPDVDLVMTIGNQPKVTLRVTNTTGQAATLSGWIDYNADGVFDNATERAQATVPTGTSNGLVTLTFPVVAGNHLGTTYARFRLGTDVAAQDPTGAALGGEVEDYRATIQATGLAEVQSGPGGITKLASDTTTNLNLSDFAQYGQSVVSLGDLDGNGVVDLAVGVPDASLAGGGAVYIQFMEADGTASTVVNLASGLNGMPILTNGSYFGTALANIGDLNGDGVTDLAVGSQDGGVNGKLYVLFLNADGTVHSSTELSSGINGTPIIYPGEYFAGSVTSLGDLNGDGVTDLAVGSGRFSSISGGSVYVLFMNADGTVASSTRIGSGVNGGPALTSLDSFGSSVANIGDLNGDGVTDLAVGAYRDFTGGPFAGSVYVLFLNDDGTAASSTKIAGGLNGGPPLNLYQQFGASLANIGDLNGDGVNDLAVGASQLIIGTGGMVYVLYMNADGTVATYSEISSGFGGGPILWQDDYFGTSVANVGDLDGDGVVDLAVGAIGDDGAGYDRGAVYLLRLTAGNAAPTALSLSSALVAENQPAGTAIGTFTSTDPDIANTFAYTLVSGSGDTDNASFTIVGDQLRTAAPLNFEARSSYSIRVRTTDQGGRTYEEAFTITVTDVPEGPTALVLSSDTVTENQPAGTTVGTFSSTDPNSVTFTYTLVSGSGDGDNSRFTIVGSELRTAAAFDYEADHSYSIRVRTTNSSSQSYEQTFTISVANVNEAPTAINLSGNTVAENQPTGTVVGAFATVDPDVRLVTAARYTYTLVPGDGDADNAAFTIVDGELRTAAPFDFEAKSSYTIRVRSTDHSDLFTEQTFTIAVTNVNEAPTLQAGAVIHVNERLGAGVILTTFAATDPDAGDTFTYAIVGGEGLPFAIDGNKLVLTDPAAAADFFRQASADLTIRVVDAGSLSNDRVFTVQIDAVQRLYRAYNAQNDSHFFTTSLAEFENALLNGYSDEANNQIGFDIVIDADPNTTPLFRLYNLFSGQHYYTLSAAERDFLVSLVPAPTSDPDTRTFGWREEGVPGYLYATQVPGSVEVFRLYNTVTGGHLYTLSESERDETLAMINPATGLPFWELHSRLGYAFFSDVMTTSSSASARAAAASAAASPDDETEEGAPESNVASLIATADASFFEITVASTSTSMSTYDVASVPVDEPVEEEPLTLDGLFADSSILSNALLSE